MKKICRSVSNFTRSSKPSSLLSAFLAMTTAPLHAEPTIGFGLSISFGQEKVDPGFGVRLFSDDRKETTVGSVGLDYMLRSQTWRGTVGVAQLYEDAYMGLELGIGLSKGDFSFGGGVGLTETADIPTETPALEDQVEGPEDMPDLEISESWSDSPPSAFYEAPVLVEYPDNYIPERDPISDPWNGGFDPTDLDLGPQSDTNAPWTGALPQYCWQC
ncbi:hypothetical protein [Yoonia sp.]|uniref:hypothetical protein n=1 Tax=Yoonia sp. TaxID=2212373 RepID=UPI00358FCB52